VRGLGGNVKTRYAVQAVIYLAQQERLQVVPVSEIATAAAIPPKFLEDILGALRTAGIVQSRRGKEGGYLLVPSPTELTVLDMVRALEGPASPSARETVGPIAQVTAAALDRALQAALGALAGLTIDQLADEAHRLEVEQAASYMYHL
jgi:Rrf2 family protein